MKNGNPKKRNSSPSLLNLNFCAKVKIAFAESSVHKVHSYVCSDGLFLLWVAMDTNNIEAMDRMPWHSIESMSWRHGCIN